MSKPTGSRNRKPRRPYRSKRPVVLGGPLMPNPGSLLGAALSIGRNVLGGGATRVAARAGGGYSTPTVGRALGKQGAYGTGGTRWDRPRFDEAMRRMGPSKPPTAREFGRALVTQPNVVGMTAAAGSKALRRGLNATGLDYPLRRGLIPSSKGPTTRRKAAPKSRGARRK